MGWAKLNVSSRCRDSWRRNAPSWSAMPQKNKKTGDKSIFSHGGEVPPWPLSTETVRYGFDGSDPVAVPSKHFSQVFKQKRDGSSQRNTRTPKLE